MHATSTSLICRVLLVTGMVAQEAGGSHEMEQQIRDEIRGFKGVMGVAAVDRRSGRTLGVNADTRFPTASTIKLAVMLEAYHQAAEGRLSLQAPVVLRDADKVGGSGVLGGLHDGLSLTVRDLIHLMIVLSDNTATNMLVTRLGTANIDRRLEAYGLRETRLFRPTFRDGRADVLPELEREFGLGMTTPREMARLMALIGEGKAVDRAASDAMVATLERQQDRSMIPRLIADLPGVTIGNKTGTDAEKHPGPDGVRRHVRGDVAIVLGPDLRYTIAIFARQVEDRRPTVDNEAVTTAARVSRLVFDYFSRPR